METLSDVKTPEDVNSFPIALKIAVGYFLLIGLYSAYDSITASWPFQLKPQILSQGFFLAGSVRGLLCVLFIVPGVGLIYRKQWARKMALGLLLVNTIFSVFLALWAIHAYNAPVVAYWGIVIILIWNGFGFYLLMKKSLNDALTQ